MRKTRVIDELPKFHKRVLALVLSASLQSEYEFILKSETYPEGIEVKVTRDVLVIDNKLREKITLLEKDSDFKKLVFGAWSDIEDRHRNSFREEDRAECDRADLAAKEKVKQIAEKLELPFNS